MQMRNLPPPSRFMFWCISPFLVAVLVLMPVLARPPAASGWIVLWGFWLLCLFALFGFWNPKKFRWCWRAVGGIVCLGYVAYFVSTALSGDWIGDGRRSSATALGALVGLYVFGYPGFMYAIFGRFTWQPETAIDKANT